MKSDKRIIAVFGVKSPDQIPKVSTESLKTYFDFLDRRLSLPIRGSFELETGPHQTKTYAMILESLDPEHHLTSDFSGILVDGIDEVGEACIALAEFDPENKSNENGRLINDYRTWFWNYR